MNTSTIVRGIEDIIHIDPGKRGLQAIWDELKASNQEHRLYHLYDSSKHLMDSSRNILIATGFVIPSVKKPETDGPPGALSIARALKGIGKSVSIITAPGNAPLLGAMLNKEKEMLDLDIPLIIAPLLKDVTDSKSWAKNQLKEFDTLVSIEILGAASDGGYYNMRGTEASSLNSPIDLIFQLAYTETPKIPTICIGDGGNEIGMGSIHELVKKHIPNGATIGAAGECSHLITTGVSNWGGYAIAASLYLLSGRSCPSYVLPDEATEAAYLDLMLEHGAVDGPTCTSSRMVDGLDFSYHAALINKIRAYLCQTQLVE